MYAKNKLLQIKQLDYKIEGTDQIKDLHVPKTGWINTIRKALNMSLIQLGNRMGITPQSVRALELRESEGKITIRSLQEAANALDMTLVYGLIPKSKSLESMVEEKAREMATQIVKRTSITMKLENQENSEERIEQAVNEMTAELKREIPKTLWD